MASDMQKRAEISKTIKDTRESLDKASLDYLLADRRGRWFLQRLFQRCHIYSQTFGDIKNTNDMLAFEGERRVALTIRRNIMLLPGGFDALQVAEREEFDTEKNFKEMLDRTKRSD